MDYVVVRTHVVNHERFLEAGTRARDLWTWGMLYAGQHETDGELPMVAVLASPWGHGGKRNVLLANKLVEVGLWERTDKGYRIRKWAEQGNKTRVEIEGTRAGWRAKAAAKRKRDASFPQSPIETPIDSLPGTPQRVLNSNSYSSGSSSSGESARGERPEWFNGVLATIETSCEPILDPAGAWLRYRGHRDTKRIPMSVPDAEQWVTAVIVKEQREARDRRRQSEDLARQRRADPPGVVEHRKTKAEREAEADMKIDLFKRISAEQAAKKATG